MIAEIKVYFPILKRLDICREFRVALLECPKDPTEVVQAPDQYDQTELNEPWKQINQRQCFQNQRQT